MDINITQGKTGELKKLKIQAYTNAEFTTKLANGEFLTSMTPQRYTHSYKTEQNAEQAPGTIATALKFFKKLPEDLELEFVFDRSGILPDFKAQPTGIVDDIDKFKVVVVDYNGEKHKPNYVMIHWGSLLFKGVLTEMNIEYKLFASDGAPIRAVAKVKFQGFIEDNLRVALENKSSPDLTHYRTVKAGDTLPLMTFSIYGDSKYYLEVAKVNGIANFRKLEVGQQIWFPPVQKQS